MHKVFISFHSADKGYKDSLIKFNEENSIFIDASVDTGEISDDLSDESIRQKIRDEYLRDSSVTILLVGQGTKGRKHVDWEVYSSMFDGKVNKRSGVLVVLLPRANPENCWTAAHDNEKSAVYPETSNWMSIDNRAEYERRYPYLPARIIDNLVSKEVKLSVVPWEKLTTKTLTLLIENAFQARTTNEYDLSRAMRRANA
ncbi:TIR domain-containing protein [Shewanella algae]|uniref:TIR domain-containing protein n=1 Tax=Shewanella algae TaxID=38313 RepID=UPI00222E69DD|nr:TIR domain-containing protein [Shewanella algae]UZD57565.1 TIR domain-containing protein [Shewanella algae]